MQFLTIFPKHLQQKCIQNLIMYKKGQKQAWTVQIKYFSVKNGCGSAQGNIKS